LPENIDQASRVLDRLVAAARENAENVQAYVTEFEYRYELSEEDQKSNGKKDRNATKKTQATDQLDPEIVSTITNPHNLI